MSSNTSAGKLAIAYLLGALTLFPILAVAGCVLAWFALPRRQAAHLEHPANRERPELHTQELRSDSEKPCEYAAYFAVARQFLSNITVAMLPEDEFRSDDDLQASRNDGDPGIHRAATTYGYRGESTDKANAAGGIRKTFYVVLRHGHLLLFDDALQLDVKYAISLALYHVAIHGDETCVPEAELWIKRNAIRLTRIGTSRDIGHMRPFYFFSDNCTAKEDFYYALLSCQRNLPDYAGPRIPLSNQIDRNDMVKLIKQLHMTEETAQTRWLNALIGRVFLATYRTSRLTRLIKSKISKKLSRVVTPSFIRAITLQHVSLGDSAPLLVNPKLKHMTLDGSLTVEADVRYNGSFKAIFTAIARIDLGQRFKPRDVELKLASVLTRLDGHLLMLIKPPPSNRIWITFESMPRFELLLEPIVSTRQITYGIILRTIESKIREVFGESLVYPNWDDIPFAPAEDSIFPGGLWGNDEPDEHPSTLKSNSTPSRSWVERGLSAEVVPAALESTPRSATVTAMIPPTQETTLVTESLEISGQPALLTTEVGYASTPPDSATSSTISSLGTTIRNRWYLGRKNTQESRN